MRKHRLHKRSAFAAAVLVLSMLVARSPAQQVQPAAEHAGEYSQADVQSGSVVYAGQCSQCHGPTGDQVAGVDLRSGRFRNAATDDDLRRIVTNGLPGTSMPGRRLEPAQLTAIVAYIRNMRDFNSKTVALGDSARGRVVFEGAGACVSCHRVAGRGSLLGPDLSEIGSSRNAATLQQSLIDPNSTMMPINRPVRIVTRDGQTISGRRLNEDTYTIQLITDQERLLSVAKTDLRDYQILTTSSMPSYAGKLNPQEVSDVVAYLTSLRAAGRGAPGAGRQAGPGQGGPPAGRQGPPPGQPR